MITEVSILPIQSVYSIDDRMITAEVLHEEPLIVKFSNVLSDEECQNLIDCASSRLERSKLAKKKLVRFVQVVACFLRKMKIRLFQN